MLAVAAVLVAGACTGCGGTKAAPVALHFLSRPDLQPPVVTVLRHTPATAAGDVFIAPKQQALFKGPEILDDAGQPIWFHPVSGQASDFRVQTYRGKPVLTWWEGPPNAPVPGSGAGSYVIMDSSYHVVARVQSGYGPAAGDLHEFQLTPQGTALITVFRIVPNDLSAVGGPVDGKAVDGVVEEVDVATGKVVFRWHSIDHVALTESYAAVAPGNAATKPFDYFHINSIEQEPDGNLLVSARNTHAVYEIDRRTGAVLWRLGGKRSSFKMGPGTRFAWQHDARRQPDGTITIFDDEAAPAVGKQSRAIRLRLDLATRTATLVQADVSPAGVLSASQGNVQVLPGGNVFVGWGSVPRFTEFDPAGKVVFDATFSAGDDSYRDYRFAWTGTPTTRPAIAVDGRGHTATVYASWNGATEVASWRVLAGINAEHLSAVVTGPKHGFETTMVAATTAPYLAVQALDAAGHVLGTSAAVTRGGLAIG